MMRAPIEHAMPVPGTAATPRRSHAPATHVLYGATGSTFEIGRVLGKGGMGCVYLATKRSHATRASDVRLVALKLLYPDAPMQARRLFYHEGALLPRIQHPHIVQHVERGRGAIAGMGTIDYLATSYVAGETIEELLKRHQAPLAPATMLGIVAQMTDALAYLHQRGIVHGDIKLSNIMLEHASPRALLIDFGIARAPGFVGQPVAVGTPQYMAPEQLRARTCDGRADIYALGVVIYELLTGKRLFPHRTTTDIRQGRYTTPAWSDLTAKLPERIAGVIMRCLQTEPHHRYATVTMLYDDLRSSVQQLIDAAPQEGE